MTFGFRKASYFSGLYSHGEIRALVGVKSGDQKTRERILLSSDEIEAGMSGAPILDLRNNSVIGIVSEVYQGNEGQDKSLAFAIPSKIILESYSILKSGRSESEARLGPTMEDDKVSTASQKVLVAASRRIQNNYNKISKLAKTIGSRIMRADNWVLLNSGASEGSSKRNMSIDYLVCTGAQEELQRLGDLKAERDRILTLDPEKGDQNLHYIGKVEIKGADLNSRRDELVKQADAIIPIEGVKGTKHSNKQRLPF